ncbi:MAG: hypothetical protein ACUVSU_00170 [Aggregatilineaceae bacterium]
MDAVWAEQVTGTLSRRVRGWDRRLRLAISLTWLPRGMILSLGVGVTLAFVARLRPLLLPEEIVRITGALAACITAGGLVAIWGWPRSLTRSARYFDQRFDLKERVSTALELLAGRIPASPGLAERQLADAAQVANRVRPAAYLPLRVRWREIAVLVLLAGMLAWLLANNPQADALRAQRELDAAIASQATALEEAVEAVEGNSQLSPAEREALIEPLREALEILAQPGISQEEAVAALAEAAQALGDLAGGLLPEDTQPYQQAARELAGSELAAGVAQALREPDLDQAANALDELARDLAQTDLNEAQRQDLAARLDQAAGTLQAQNPALAQNLRDVAQALRSGDLGAAQQAMGQTAQVLRAQQRQLDQSALAEAARAAQQQMVSSQREVAQAGHEQAGGDMAEAQSAASWQSATGQQSGGEGGSAQSAAGEAQVSAGAEDRPPDEASSSMATGEEGEPEGGEAPQAAQQGAGTGAGDTSASAGQAASAEQTEGEAGLGAGSGEGGAGVDTTTGAQAEGGVGQVPFGVPEGEFYQYTPQNAPTTLGGESEQLLEVGGEVRDAQGVPIQQGELAPNPAGEAALSYTGALRAFRAVVSEALESGRIPLDQRDVIHDYFSSLAR